MAALGTLLYMAPNATQNQAPVVYEYQIVTTVLPSSAGEDQMFSTDSNLRVESIKFNKVHNSKGVLVSEEGNISDKQIVDMINSMSMAGFELSNIANNTTVVNGTTLFSTTKYYFRRPKK